jgi:hypothetical protein
VAEFISLADLLRPPAPAFATPVDVEPPIAVEPAVAEPPSAPDTTSVCRPEATNGELAAALRDARLFRARLADAFDDARQWLLRELASDVLARELRIAACDLDALAHRIFVEAPFVRIRVAPADAAAISSVPVVADPELDDGDAIVEFAGGAVDARLGVRLADVLEAFA